MSALIEVDKELYPFESHYLTLNGSRLHYLDEGEGDPVVMVHGNPTWSFYYRNLAKALRETHRVIVPDHIGCGMSDKPDDDHYSYRFEQRADDLEGLLEHLDVKQKITLVVHDWGGMIGMLYATRYPERIARIVVLNTAAFHQPATKSFPWQLWLAKHSGMGTVLVRGFNMFCRGAARSCVRRKPMSPEVRAGYLAPYGSWKDRIAVMRFVEDIPLKPKDPGFDLITQVQDGLAALEALPMMICWGLKDFVFDHHFLAEWERRFPRADVHRFEDAGHYILEDAADEIIPLVQSFMSRTADLADPVGASS